jgi:hypothetical protein
MDDKGGKGIKHIKDCMAHSFTKTRNFTKHMFFKDKYIN